jgi:hypothetical protein
MNKVIYVLITKRIEYDESPINPRGYDVLKLHGLFTSDGLIKYKNEIRKIRNSLPTNSLFIVPLDRFLEKGVKL